MTLGRGWFGILLLCIVNVALWFVTKVYLGELLGYSHVGLIALLDISYYLVKALSFVLDVNCKKFLLERNLGRHLLYLTYFLTVVQVPFLRYNQLTEKMSKLADFDANRWASVITVILVGLDSLQNRKIDVIENVCSLHFVVRTCVYMLLIYDILLFGVYGAGYDAAGFLYGGF